MTQERPEGGLSPVYQSYGRQKCFLGYSEQAEWAPDLLGACQEVLLRFGLEVDSAAQHFKGDVPLREKVLELIANARYGIYDVSHWEAKGGGWQVPRNVLIELGMAVALNRPALLLLHRGNSEDQLPACLRGLSDHLVRFSGETTLKRELEARLPRWVEEPPDRAWWSRGCVFGGRSCEYREAHPRKERWGRQSLPCLVADGPDPDREDFRAGLEEVLGRYSGVEVSYLEKARPARGYDFLLCGLCQAVRAAAFGVYRVTEDTSAEAYLALGMNLALGAQFKYAIPNLTVVRDERQLPSLLRGYEAVEARNGTERKAGLRRALASALQRVRETTWRPAPLPFTDLTRPAGQDAPADGATGRADRQLIGDSPAMRELRRAIARLAAAPETVLIEGETGSGKDLVALALHQLSPRHRGPLVTVSCAAISSGGVGESQLFGYVRGAFAGAARDSQGYFAQADGGTLFLDELDGLPLEVQAKLLRAVETKCFRPVGALSDSRADVRIIAATNRDLERAAREGRFRRDLLFRLISQIKVPPLREHIEDVPDLARHFLERMGGYGGRPKLTLSESALERLMGYSWPGNVRQLRSVLEGAAAMSETGEIQAGDLHLPDPLAGSVAGGPPTLNVEELEEWAIRQALARTKNNKTHAARLLGIRRATLVEKVKKYRIPETEPARAPAAEDNPPEEGEPQLAGGPAAPVPERPPSLQLEALEEWAIRHALARTKTKAQAARLLGISRATLIGQMKKYGLSG